MKLGNRFNTARDLKELTQIGDRDQSRLCDIKEWEQEDFRILAKEILGLKKDSNEDLPIHRKLWEFTSTVQALVELDLLNESSLGLSVAAGAERILYYLTNKIGTVVATDIYGHGDFSSLEANDSFLKNQKQFAPYDYAEDKLLPLYMNALDLKFEDNTFDFSFCMSSIEHFGGIKNANKAISEMSRVTKEGGYVLVATEFSLNGFKTDEVFLKNDLVKLIKGTGLNLDKEFLFSLSEESSKYCCDMRKDDLNKLPHLNLKSLSSIFTSGILILRKEGEYTKNTASDLRGKIDLIKSLQGANIKDEISLNLSLLDKIKRKLLIGRCKLEEKIFLTPKH